MGKRLIAFMVWLNFLLTGMLTAQADFSPLQHYFNWPVSVVEDGMMGAVNPANAYYNANGQTQIYWSGLRGSSIDSYYRGTITGFKGVSGSFFQQKFGPNQVNDYSFSFAGGNETWSMGTIYSWSSGDRAFFKRRSSVGMGILFRPAASFSLGGVYREMVNGTKNYFQLEAGIRPFKSEKLTLFATTFADTKMKPGDYSWTYGGEVELIEGIKLQGMFSSRHETSVGITFNLGGLSLSSLNRYDKEQDPLYYSTRIEMGKMRKSKIYEWLMKEKQYTLELKGTVDYQRYVINMDGSIQFSKLMKTIRLASSDGIRMIMLNMSGFKASLEQLWELRRELQKYKQSGGMVVIYLDNASLPQYHFASVANYVIMDPQGRLILKGFAISKTYLNRMLQKIGLEFEEWRFFKYKSAAETIARDTMSSADREQLQVFLDDLYEQIRHDVVLSRQISETQFDSLINNVMLFSPTDAQRLGLVDAIGRWKDAGDMVSKKFNRRYMSVPPMLVNNYRDVDEKWSDEPSIAVVYALGECAMDSGIKARNLEKMLLGIAKNRRIKGVVLRVDSPGGDPLASDLVAEALKEIKKNKPVIISQGAVAASGGYWISMYGDRILAAPYTITGSIGVIGGWLYDTGFAGKLGLNYEVVKVGDHADFMAGPRLPLLGLQVPGRNLNGVEKMVMKRHILSMYGEFVSKVAQGRHLDSLYVHQHGEGRIYSGNRAKNNKLIDEIGTMADAIQYAAEKAHLKPDEYEVIEYGDIKGFFPFPFANSGGIETRLGLTPMEYYYLTYSLKNPLMPFMMVNPSYVEIQ